MTEMGLEKWRVDCSHGVGAGARVSLNGVELNGVRAVSISIATDDVVTATLVVENVEVAIGEIDSAAYRAETEALFGGIPSIDG